jgi:hypothetical protein
MVLPTRLAKIAATNSFLSEIPVMMHPIAGIS